MSDRSLASRRARRARPLIETMPLPLPTPASARTREGAYRASMTLREKIDHAVGYLRTRLGLNVRQFVRGFATAELDGGYGRSASTRSDILARAVLDTPAVIPFERQVPMEELSRIFLTKLRGEMEA